MGGHESNQQESQNDRGAHGCQGYTLDSEVTGAGGNSTRIGRCHLTQDFHFGRSDQYVQSIAEPWADTTTPAGRMVLTVFAGIAEFERSLIAALTEEGRRAAQARGVPFGRPPKLLPEQRTLVRHSH